MRWEEERLSVSELARRTGLSRAHLSQVLRGVLVAGPKCVRQLAEYAKVEKGEVERLLESRRARHLRLIGRSNG